MSAQRKSTMPLTANVELVTTPDGGNIIDMSQIQTVSETLDHVPAK